MKHLVGLFFLWAGSVVWAQYQTEIQVAQDGTGDFTTLQAAIDGTKAFPDQRITIFIKPGLYREKVEVHAWNNRLRLKGESADKVVIRWGDSFDSIQRGRNSTFHTATLRVQGDDFRAEDLTVENSAGPVGQAVALAVEADRCVFENCRILGHQDTLYADGANTRQYYHHCWIEGTTDFIFGGATALFESCTIHSKANSYMTAASTPAGRRYGFVFLGCTLSAADDVNAVYLGRPWRSSAKTVFVKCDIGAHIRPEGWQHWNSPAQERSVYYAEGGNTGPGADTSQRVTWSKRLSEDQIKTYTAQEVLQPFLLPEMRVSAPQLNIPKDTSYTLASALAKYKKYYPMIRAVEYDKAAGSLQQAEICYDSVDGRPLSLDIFAVTTASESPKPVVILIHGGGWSSGDRSLMYPLADALAHHGFVAVPVEYRLSPEAPYPAAVDDLKNAITWMVNHVHDYHIDTRKVVVLGCSAGAQLASLVGLTYGADQTGSPAPARMGAIINIDGIMDFTCAEARKYEDDPNRESTPAGRWLGGRYSERPERWKEASPVYYVDEHAPPMLFINSSQPRFHAGRDEVIQKLNQFSIASEVHTFSDAPHSFWLFDPWFERTETFIVTFLDRTLGVMR